MKKIKYIIILVLAYGMLNSCSDFLDRTPLDAIGDESFFNKDNDLKYYMNGLYGGIIRENLRNRITSFNIPSDDVVTNGPNGTLMQHSTSGLAGEVNKKGWNDRYDYIRKTNYFLKNAYRVSPLTAKAKHYIGEGYYCRASKYFELLMTFGGVPYVTEVLNTDSEELYRPRDSRTFVAEKIIADLDSAILHLNWKGVGEAASGRINKESALLLQSRVTLYEGTWQYYHARKNTPFAEEGSDGMEFLEKTVAASEELIDKYGANIYIGSKNNEYFDYFNREDYSKTQGVFFYRTLTQELNVPSKTESGHAGFECGLTKGAIDAYLMSDGKPVGVSAISLDDTKTIEIVKNKDPRLRQTIWSSEKGLINDYWPFSEVATKTSFAGIIMNQERAPSYSGYRVWKSSYFGFENLETDDLIMRYEEALLNYAEAKAVLGTITQDDLDRSINVIRNRVGMVPMNLAEINGWSIQYNKVDGYDLNAPNIVNEIRRERRVELILEGFRLNDIKRWAMYDDVFNGVKPVGAHVQEFLDYWNDPTKLAADGFDYKTPEEVKLTLGSNVDVINGYINTFFKHADFKATSGRGYYIDPSRDYLSPIPKEEITLYKNRAGVILEQNPGWF